MVRRPNQRPLRAVSDDDHTARLEAFADSLDRLTEAVNVGRGPAKDAGVVVPWGIVLAILGLVLTSLVTLTATTINTRQDVAVHENRLDQHSERIRALERGDTP